MLLLALMCRMEDLDGDVILVSASYFLTFKIVVFRHIFLMKMMLYFLQG